MQAVPQKPFNGELLAFPNLTERVRKAVEAQYSAEERAALVLIRRILNDPDLKPPASDEEAQALQTRLFRAGFDVFVETQGSSPSAPFGVSLPKTTIVAYKRVRHDSQIVFDDTWQTR